jgi:flagellar secretion chaperone FliS
MTSPAMRNRYLGDTVATASPGRLLVMLYERLVLDLARAETALRAGDRETGANRLLHAQEIVMELQSSLNLSVWDGAAGLGAVYGFLLTELITANVRADADRAASCRELVEPLLDAWRKAMAITERQASAERQALAVA